MDLPPLVWLPLTVPDPGFLPTADQTALLEEVRTLLARLQPARAGNSWAVLLEQDLVLVFPLDRERGWTPEQRGSLHLSLQMVMRARSNGAEIAGAWHEAHYAWDYEPKSLDFRISGHRADSRAGAVTWLESQLRRAIVRDDWMMAGRVVCSRWRDGEEPQSWSPELHGFFPVALLRSRHPDRSLRAGFLDPW